MGSRSLKSEPVYLGLECGATHTVALARGTQTLRREFGPANLRLLTDAQLARHFRVVAKAMPRPSAVAIGMAGARSEADRERIRRAAAKAWPQSPCYATSDLETALAAAASNNQPAPAARVLVLSGTGSCCFGHTTNGRKNAKVGGWGHILGDKGSGFEIGLRALKAVVYYLDRDGEWSGLGRRVLRALQLNEPEELIGWVQAARKDEIAALAVEVFCAAAAQDRIASDILAGAACGLANDAVACASRLVARRSRVQFVLAGGVLTKQPQFSASVGRRIRALWPGASVEVLRREGVWGAVELAARAGQHPVARKWKIANFSTQEVASIQSLALSPTEQRLPASMNLDKLPVRHAIALMLREDAKIPPALLAERAGIERGVNLVTRSLRRGGRLFYVGAGTSGRLGVLDASECPPTFRTDPEMVQGIIAGGQKALWSAVEGAEDDPSAGARAIQFRSVGKRDTVVGIAASGRTPFVWGALREARRRGAATILICFNPHLRVTPMDRPTLVIAPRIGPEVLTGSTRLKSGTATKLILNIFTTLAMVRLGKVLGNLMIDVKASNTKLRDRAVRIVRELTGADYETARAALLKEGWKIKPACRRLGIRQ